ncbi:hypothetical protein HDK77DRAFT_67592 [Phyllosticta capitalensis]
MPPALEESESFESQSPGRSRTMSPSNDGMPPPPRPTKSGGRRARVDESSEEEDESERPPVSTLPPANKRPRYMAGLHPSQDVIGGMSQGWDMPNTGRAQPSRRKTRSRGVAPKKQPQYDSKHHPMDVVMAPKRVAKKGYKSLVDPITIDDDDEDDDDEESRRRDHRNRRRGSGSSYEGAAVDTNAKGRPKATRKSKRKSTRKSTSKPIDTVDFEDPMDLEDDEDNDDGSGDEDEDQHSQASTSNMSKADIIKRLDSLIQGAVDLKRDVLKGGSKKKKQKSAPAVPIHEDDEEVQENILRSRPHFPLPRSTPDFAKENDASRNTRSDQSQSDEDEIQHAGLGVNPRSTILQDDLNMEEADDREVSQYIHELANDGIDTGDQTHTAQTEFVAINTNAGSGAYFPQRRRLQHTALPQVIEETQSQLGSVQSRTPPQTGRKNSPTPQPPERTVRDTHLTASQSARLDEESQLQRYYREDDDEDDDEEEDQTQDEEEEAFGSEPSALSEIKRKALRRERSYSL